MPRKSPSFIHMLAGKNEMLKLLDPPNAMEERRGSIADSGSILSFYTAPAQQSPQPTARPQIWMRRRDTDFGSDCFSKRESVVIRDSIAYPSESSFEDTIVKGTAQTLQRNPSKPRLIDLDYIRRKMLGATTRRGSQQSTKTDTSGSSSFTGWFPEMRPPEPIVLSPITSQRAVTEMYHESQSDIVTYSRARASSLRGPETPLQLQSGARGRQSGETVRSSYESERSDYSVTQNIRQHKRSCMRSLWCALY
ncbi:hypothetical protein Daesc_005640 [Daldinia eschscholtzii]|uniref:Uncharacterized protein n=1 Tax=Daldinia eschscholtzii TaxID=292717 RepID=A0AAX6MLQ6_9PEZI